MKRKEAEERQVALVQEKNDLALQLQAVRLKEIETSGASSLYSECLF